MTFIPYKATSLPSLSDIEQGAEVYRKAPYAKEVTPVERAAYSAFMELTETMENDQWHFEIAALLLAGLKNEAYDFLIKSIEMNQPESDAWGDAADRGNDERGM